MDEHPALALREKKDSTILVAMDLVRRGEADAVVTAGHTGAGMAAAILRLGRLPGVDRPALAVQMITDAGTLVLLDIGANPDSTPENLLQYAQMGAIFAERVVGVASPRVALLSIGEEKGKGDARIQRATELLDTSALRFEGNVEGKDLTRNLADVVVCDAVLGNVVIKFFEGLSTFIFDQWRAEFYGSLRGKLAGVLMKPGIDRIRGTFDYERVGGSPLLGVKGTVIITHGRAKRRMIGFACSRSPRRRRGPASRSASPKPWRRVLHERERAWSRTARSAGTSSPSSSGWRRSRFQGSSGSAAAGRPARRLIGGRRGVRFEGDRVRVRLWVVARPGQEIRSLTTQVGTAVAATVERLLGLELADVTVLVDGVGN